MMANELNMVSKHSTEKVAAQLVDCFTTVSDITARECEQLLDIKPHVVTPNGFEDDFVSKGKEFTAKRKAARSALKTVAETLLGYEIPANALYVSTGGRYEFKNKGIDIFIESLKYLSDSLKSDRQVVAFIMVPAWIKSHREDLLHCLQHPGTKLNSYNRITTHELHDFYNDNVMSTLHWFHLRNQESDKVKVIFVPSYLNGSDGIFNKTYYDLLVGMDLTVFPSYYEPWGYTPLESIAFGIPTITTTLAGFGLWAKKSVAGNDIREGVVVMERTDSNYREVADGICDKIVALSEKSTAEIESIHEHCTRLAEQAQWSKFITYYQNAFCYALAQSCKRNG